jgi:hypothetical protein
VQTLELVTPSYAPDRALCGDLVRSAARFAPGGTTHTVIVPPRDLALFAPLAEAGAVVRSTAAVFPRGFAKIPGANVWLSRRAPWPPVRGWIAQQIVKLAAVAASTADAVLVVDSDVEFVRPFSVADFLVDGRVPLYRLPDAVTAALPRHMVWDAVARRLLGVSASAAAQHPDYICWPCLWEPALVRAALARVEEVTGLPWAAAVGRELHFSEMVLYGVYADQLAGVAAHTDDMHCPSFSDESALDAAGIAAFLERVRPDDVAVMISAKSGTDLATRRAAIRRFVGDEPAGHG